MKIGRGNILQLAVILALVTGTISPACKFISGKTASTVELCTPYGLKELSVPGTEEHAGRAKHERRSVHDCPFCLTFAKTKSFKTDRYALTYPPLLALSFVPPRRDHSTAAHLVPETVWPRAPPAISLI